MFASLPLTSLTSFVGIILVLVPSLWLFYSGSLCIGLASKQPAVKTEPHLWYSVFFGAVLRKANHWPNCPTCWWRFLKALGRNSSGAAIRLAYFTVLMLITVCEFVEKFNIATWHLIKSVKNNKEQFTIKQREAPLPLALFFFFCRILYLSAPS